MDKNQDEELNWKTRPYHNKQIIAPVRDQKQKSTCFIHSSCTCGESLLIRAGALEEPQKDFEIMFSDEKLQDVYEKKHGKIGEESKGKGFIRLVRISEILMEEGAVGTDKNGEICGPFKIKSFQKLDPQYFPKSTKACPSPEAKMPSRVQDILRKGNCMVGTFKLSENYLELKPGEIYSYDRHHPIIVEGLRGSHAVAIIGYGVRGGEWYYVFQNSHGENWGEGGIGRVNMNSLVQLVQFKL